VILHGGEPLLLGADAIVDFAIRLRTNVPRSVSVDIGLQTNGLLVTEKVLNAFELENIAVSLSLDGPREANDLHRKTRKGRSSFDKAASALECLTRHPKIFSGVIAVIDPRVAPEVLYEFFNEHRPPKIDFLLPDANHARPPPGRDLRPNQYREWLIRAFDLWFDVYPHLPLRTFEALLDATAGLPSRTDAFGLGDVSLLTIETDRAYHDLDVLKIVGQGATKLKGSVRDTEIAVVAASQSIENHRALLRDTGLCGACQLCPEVKVCGGGSLPHRFGQNGFDNPTVYCQEMLSLIGHIRSRLRETLTATNSRSLAENQLSADFDLCRFESAEQADALVANLWKRVCAEQLERFHLALQILRDGRPDVTRAIAQIEKLDQGALVQLACRPGSVAWQRATLGSSAGIAMFAVDGSPLRADEAYLDSLLGSAANRAGLRISDGDPWLRVPFGNAIIFEPEEVVERARPVADAALRIINDWRPGLNAELRTICQDIQFIRDPAADPDKIVSFSDNVVPGALYVSVLRGGRLIDPYDLADSLIHEHRHQKLYLLERLCPMIEPTDMKVVSPWREDLRPPSGLLHALFVFVELRRFWDHVRVAGPAHLHVRAVNQLRETDAHLEEGFATLRSCPLTSVGRALATVLDNARIWQSAA
jgi:uncharacterized protein